MNVMYMIRIDEIVDEKLVCVFRYEFQKVYYLVVFFVVLDVFVNIFYVKVFKIVL